MTDISVMLAGEFANVAPSFPYLASVKLDGIRAKVRNGVVLSRNGLAIPNPDVQALFGDRRFNGLDGELIVGPPNAPDAFRRTGAVMRHKQSKHESKQTPRVTFWVFDDYTHAESPFQARFLQATRKARHRDMNMVAQVMVKDENELQGFEEGALEQGYEGVMLRAPHGRYKFGRCGKTDPWLLKLKRFADSEAEVLGVVEQMHNTNEDIRDALGRAKRSSAKAGKVGAGVLGALNVCDVHTNVSFDIGTGWTNEERAELWDRRRSLRGLILKYKYFPTGSKDKPRFPVFLGWRDAFDR